ncbi:MAG: hypothetical protein U0X40_08140 [Ferruginibacter sp.]
MQKRIFVFSLLTLVCLQFANSALAQPTWTYDLFGKIKKPTQFENRKLGSEKMADKKFTVYRNVVQNNVTHFNYYFNANNKVNAVVERAKMSNRDDYSRLLAFYPYDLKGTSAQKNDLDSVITTCTAGILLHDLRNDWIDNMYLLIGKAYFYRQELDSAEMTFQFINYNLFPRKKHEEDNRIVGTTSAAVGSAISIANKEKRNILQKMTALPPSRNDAIIWLIRTWIEKGEYGDAAGLINTLQQDRNLPKRLRNDLEEVNAYWFYKQGIYDSSAVHLEKGLSNADDKEDKSRWKFLLAQLYEMSGRYDKASEYYTKAAKQTVSPLLDIYARLNEAKMLRDGSDAKELNKTIDKLVKMAHRDKYETFRDVIYYSAGQLSLKKPDTTQALGFFKKSLKYNENNLTYKNKAFLQMADIAYKRKEYRSAAALYDSLQTSDTTLADRLDQIQTRKAALTKIADAITNIEKEDSLQRIAAMEPAARDLFVKALVRKLRKEKGLKEDASLAGGGDFNNPFSNSSGKSVDLFATNESKGEWYFNNSALKSKGFNEFKSRWGNRANVDNWRRRSAIEFNNAANNPTPDSKKTPDNKSGNKGNTANPADNPEISYDALMKDVPLTPEKLAASNETLASNLLELAKLYQNELEEYELAAATYEDYLRRFPQRLADGEPYLGLYYCYSKLGNKEKAAYYKDLLQNKFPNSAAAQKLNPAVQNNNSRNGAATPIYDSIYTLFLEGDFEKAVAEKKKADSLYGENYWTPQLLYIEALYNVKQRNDSAAIAGLQALSSRYPGSPLKEKAATMIDVLKRRKEIETYLTNLQVTRDTDNVVTIIPDKPQPVTVVKKQDTVKLKDTVKVAPPLSSGSYVLNPAAPHSVIMILEKVDNVYTNEAKNALDRYNRENFYGQPIQIAKEALDADHNILVISSFANADAALQYYDKIRREAKNEISWLPANKYSFLIITAANLDVLKAGKNISAYKSLLNTQYPNRF